LNVSTTMADPAPDAPSSVVDWRDCDCDVGEVVVLAQSPKALLVRFCTIELEPAWISRRHIRDGSEVSRKGDRGLLVISRWMAQTVGAYRGRWLVASWRKLDAAAQIR